MCDDLENVLEIQEQTGTDASKGALALFRTTAKTIKKVVDKFEKHVATSEQKLSEMAGDIKELRTAFDDYKVDAVKYRLVIDVFKALFGTTKKAVLTLVYMAVILGLANIKDIIELLKMFV